MLLIKAGLEGQEGEKRRTDRQTESAHVAKGRDGEVRCGLLKRNPGDGMGETDTQREGERETNFTYGSTTTKKLSKTATTTTTTTQTARRVVKPKCQKIVPTIKVNFCSKLII